LLSSWPILYCYIAEINVLISTYLVMVSRTKRRHREAMSLPVKSFSSCRSAASSRCKLANEWYIYYELWLDRPQL